MCDLAKEDASLATMELHKHVESCGIVYEFIVNYIFDPDMLIIMSEVTSLSSMQLSILREGLCVYRSNSASATKHPVLEFTVHPQTKVHQQLGRTAHACKLGCWLLGF